MKFQKPEFYEKKVDQEQMKEALSGFLSIMPGSVKVDNVDYKIISKEKVFLNGRLVFGAIDYVTSEIEIANGDVSLPNQKVTLMHEIVHAIAQERDIKDLLPQDNDQMEKLVNEIAKGMLQVIRDNPELIKFIK